MVKDYIRTHLEDGRYLKSYDRKSSNIWGWDDYRISRHAIFSYRKTYYTSENFSEKLHTHDFYELVLCLSGNVEYINGDHVFEQKKRTPTIIINRPGELHTTRLLSHCFYERYVLYFDREFLSFFEELLPFAKSLDSLSGFALTFDTETCSRILSLFEHAKESLTNEDALSVQYAYTDILSLFAELSSENPLSTEIKHIPDNILKIKNHVDCKCCEIKNVNMIADSFFYSREHISRLFKKYFNVNLADYLSRQKCERSKEMLLSGEKVGNVYFKCGFGSLPSYVRAFKQFYKMTPAEFIRMKRI